MKDEGGFRLTEHRVAKKEEKLNIRMQNIRGKKMKTGGEKRRKN